MSKGLSSALCKSHFNTKGEQAMHGIRVTLFLTPEFILGFFFPPPPNTTVYKLIDCNGNSLHASKSPCSVERRTANHSTLEKMNQHYQCALWTSLIDQPGSFTRSYVCIKVCLINTEFEQDGCIFLNPNTLPPPPTRQSSLLFGVRVHGTENQAQSETNAAFYTPACARL